VPRLSALPFISEVQDVQMKCIQNKIITSQKAFIIHIYGLHHYKGKLLKFFSEYITFSINFNVGFQVLKVVDLNLADKVLYITPQEKIQWG
jgi:hypothetical protein